MPDYVFDFVLGLTGHSITTQLRLMTVCDNFSAGSLTQEEVHNLSRETRLYIIYAGK